MELEVKHSFFKRFDKTISKALKGQIKNFAQQQLSLVSELELFRWKALKEGREDNPEIDRKLPKPHNRVLVEDPNKLFSDEDAANAIKQMFGYLWENKDVFDAFSNAFLVPYCEEMLQKDPFKVDQILDLVIHRLFCDLTEEVPDLRVVTIL
mmetsp:Transcript_34536/g.45429  ORF Transcript_34536/g.45429 Transcript_34536/m.45429 type:complete len:152 (+) Transcript_34536:123-578(+)